MAASLPRVPSPRGRHSQNPCSKSPPTHPPNCVLTFLSPANRIEREREQKQKQKQKRSMGSDGKSYWGMAARECDSCKGSPALLFCRADSAFLCGACDARVHGANKLASRHERVWMCEVCEQAPAAVTCKADAAALCVSCDADIHSANPLARRHDRVPVVPLYEVPAGLKTEGGGGTTTPELLLKPTDEEEDDDDDDEGVNEFIKEAEVASWLLPNTPIHATNGHKSKLTMEAPELKVPVGDYYCSFSDVDPYLDPAEYTSPMDDARYHQTASAAAYRPTFIAPDSLDFGRSKPSYGSYPSLSHSISSTTSEVGVVPDAGALADITNPYGGQGQGDTAAAAPQAVAAGGMDREARVMRYREKRKNRKFEKTVRYASRKAYAETRPRIKGRFAKRTELEVDVDCFYSAAAAATLMDDPDYGVVPSFS